LALFGGFDTRNDDRDEFIAFLQKSTLDNHQSSIKHRRQLAEKAFASLLLFLPQIRNAPDARGFVTASSDRRTCHYGPAKQLATRSLERIDPDARTAYLHRSILVLPRRTCGEGTTTHRLLIGKNCGYKPNHENGSPDPLLAIRAGPCASMANLRAERDNVAVVPADLPALD
jgi:hypothetical protein